MKIRITIEDYDNYESDNGLTGGKYGFEEVAIIENGKLKEGSHWTTAAFEYCENCGNFYKDIRDHKISCQCNSYRPSSRMEKIINNIS